MIVVPDVIVHRRGDNSRNLLVIEMKKKCPNQDGVDWDRQRIEAFCKDPFNYCFGALAESSSSLATRSRRSMILKAMMESTITTAITSFCRFMALAFRSAVHES